MIKKIILTILLTALITAIPTFSYEYYEGPFNQKIDFENKEYNVKAVELKNRLFVAAKDVKKTFNLTVEEGPFSSLFVGDYLIKDFLTIKGKPYVSLELIAQKMGYSIKVCKDNTLIFQKKSGFRRADYGAIEIFIIEIDWAKRKKLNKIDLVLAVELTNPSSDRFYVRRRDFVLEDANKIRFEPEEEQLKKRYRLNAKGSVTVEKIHYSIPADSRIKHLIFVKRGKDIKKVKLQFNNQPGKPISKLQTRKISTWG